MGKGAGLFFLGVKMRGRYRYRDCGLFGAGSWIEMVFELGFEVQVHGVFVAI